jgi:hypothetical protein
LPIFTKYSIGRKIRLDPVLTDVKYEFENCQDVNFTGAFAYKNSIVYNVTNSFSFQRLIYYFFNRFYGIGTFDARD